MTNAAWWVLLPLVASAVALAPAVAAARASAPRLAAFPGLDEAPARRSPLRVRTVLLAAVAAIVLTALAAMTGAAALAAVVALASTSVLVAGFVRLRRHRAGVEVSLAAIEALSPRLTIAYAGKSGLHVGMWSPWFDRSEIAWCVTVPGDDQFDKVRMHYPQTPVVVGDLPPSVRGAFYPHGSTRNRGWIDARPDVTHVFLGHGDSDKPLSASERVLDYDLVAVAGQAAIDRFAAAGVDLPADRIRVIGRPQTEGIVPVAGPAPSPATVLYAPTWWHADDATNVSSLPVADTLIDTLLDRGCTVVFRRHFARLQHPDAEDRIAWIDTRLERAAAASGRAHRFGLEPRLVPMAQLFNEVDVLVSDVSSVVVDFMASDKPYAMYSAQYDDPEAFRSAHPSADGAYVVSRDLHDLGPAFDDLLGDDPRAAVRHARADYFLGGPERADPAARLLALLAELGGAGRDV